MKLIIGLGNPTKKYKNTRHNIGFMVIDQLAADQSWVMNKKIEAALSEKEINGATVLLLKPQTFMNNSGAAVLKICKKENIKPANIIIINDDKDLNFGDIRVKLGASSAGHKGVQSIIERLGTKDFYRVRIGIKNPLLDKIGTEKFVLQNFNPEEKKLLPQIIDHAITKIIEIIKK